MESITANDESRTEGFRSGGDTLAALGVRRSVNVPDLLLHFGKSVIGHNGFLRRRSETLGQWGIRRITASLKDSECNARYRSS
jgi:hypothetical protein